MELTKPNFSGELQGEDTNMEICLLLVLVGAFGFALGYHEVFEMPSGSVPAKNIYRAVLGMALALMALACFFSSGFSREVMTVSFGIICLTFVLAHEGGMRLGLHHWRAHKQREARQRLATIPALEGEIID